MKKKNLILTGGIRHNFDENTNAISKILNEAGFENKIKENLDNRLKEILDEISPIEDFSGRFSLEFLNHFFEEPLSILF